MEKYSFEFKLHVVVLYLSKGVSYQDLEILQGIHNHVIIVKWVNDCFDKISSKRSYI